LAETNYDSLFGKIAIDQGICTDTEIGHCFKELKSRAATEPTTLKRILVEYGYMTPTQAKRLDGNIKESKDAAGKIPGYKVLGKLGAGAMAVVYKARQLSLDRSVAIKVLPRRFSEKSNYIQRFFKEGKLAAKLNHNNIVQAIDVGEVNGIYYFVMEYVEGKTIYDDISKGKIFSEEEALDIIIQVAHALKHAHSINMIHRDVKPKNIMINLDGVVKLADMGLARETSDIKAAKSEQGKAFGTPYYIAPEQIRGEVTIDGRADIYALGATFYHMVTGRVPFEAGTPSEVMRKHLKDPIVPPDHINTSLSGGLAEVIEVMMAKKKSERYQNCEELLGDLDALQKGLPPIRARQRFNLDAMEELEQGMAVDMDDTDERLYSEEVVMKYKVWVIILSSLVGLLMLFLFFTLFGGQ
jgi:serine/threonine-protein kinase